MAPAAYPFWSFALLAMDLLILYGLTVHPEAYGDGERIVGNPPP